MEKRLIVGISGASGAPIALDVLRCLQKTEIAAHLVITRGGEMTLLQECGLSLEALRPLAAQIHDAQHIGDSIASGSFHTMGMLVVPASMKTVAGIACGYSDNLLLRAADVCLKERRRLVLCAREAPLSLIHLRSMSTVTEAGAIIVPPMLEYYNHPKTVDELTYHTACKLLALFDIEPEDYLRWEGMR